MNRKLFSSIVLLVIVLCSLTVPIISSDTHEAPGILTNGMVEADMMEIVRIFENGSCKIYIEMTVFTPSLVRVFERSLGFNDTMSYDQNYTVPASIPVEGQMVFNPNITVTKNGSTVVNGTYPVNSSFCEGIYQQQLLSLGIRITDFLNLKMLKEYETGYFLIYIDAYAEFLEVEGSGKNRKVTIGPPTWEISCDRSSFLLTQVAYIQEMLGNLTEEDTYESTWTTNIILPDTTNSSNWEELNGKNWNCSFGNNSAEINASITGASLKSVTLVENLWVSENHIGKNESQLWQDLLAYKIFKIEYDPPYTGICQAGDFTSVIDDFSWSVSFTILKIENKGFSVEFTDGTVDVEVIMDGSFSVELSAHIGFRTKWSKLKKFYGYVKLSGSLAANFTLNVKVDYEESWYMDIFEWSGNRTKPPTFWIGPVPVWLIPHFTATAKFAINIKKDFQVGCGASVDGWMIAGVGWKQRFYPILDAGMEVSVEDPWCSDDPSQTSITIIAEPSLGFKPSILFYDATGPAVEIEPYLTAKYWYNSSQWIWDYIAGVRLNVGIDFSGWFEKITGLEDWFPATIFDWELWMLPERPDHDIAVTNVRSREWAFVGENVSVCVDVVNLGSKDEDNVDVTLYFWDQNHWSPIETRTGVSVPARECKTLNFTWPTAGLEGHTYEINATATIANDDDNSNNNLTQLFDLYVQDVAVVNLTASNITQEIEVTLDNAGTGVLSAVVVQLYYGGNLYGEYWFDYLRIAFNLLPNNDSTLIFSWDITAYNDESNFSAVALVLPYETAIRNNFYGLLRCDVNGDGRIDLKDVLAVALAYGSFPGHKRWNPNCDVNNDLKVDLKDYYQVVKRYGMEW